jgi:hypothetical protein
MSEQTYACPPEVFCRYCGKEIYEKRFQDELWGWFHTETDKPQCGEKL